MQCVSAKNKVKIKVLVVNNNFINIKFRNIDVNVKYIFVDENWSKTLPC